MRHTILLIPALLLTMGISSAKASSVVESRETILTYPFSDPNPVALLTAQGDRPIYPYFRFDGYTSQPERREWKVITLENPYIKLSVLPELGGKIWGAVEKESGREFIYKNHVVKFRDVALRGAWTSGGIEFNFGILGHVPTTATPVSYCTQVHPDGTADCCVASYEWITRTWWMVRISLPPDKAYFTTSVTWHNPSLQYQPCYQWMNAAYSVRGNAEFIYPGNASVSHDGEPDTYPVNKEGKDMSRYDNIRFGDNISIHVLGEYSHFYGIYWHDWNFGSAHQAQHGDKLGAKYFIWSQARSGAIWEQLLTDQDGQYIEQQSGRMFCQPNASCALTPFKHTALAPAETDTWTEYWFPLKNIYGIKETSSSAVLNVIRDDRQLRLLLCPLSRLSTTMYVYADDTLVTTIPVETKVLEKWEYTLDMIPSWQQEGHLRVVLGNGDLCYSERETDRRTDRPLETPTDFDNTSAYALSIRGENSINQKQLAEGESFLLLALQKEPYHLPSITQLARIYNMQARYEEALAVCRKGLSVSTYDAPCNYEYALASEGLGLTTRAKDGFAMATRDPALHSASYQHLAAIAFRQGNLSEAGDFALKAMQTNTYNLSAHALLVTIFRHAGDSLNAMQHVQQILQQAPLYPQAVYEKYRLGQIAKQDFKRLVQCELPDEIYLELADTYEHLGAREETMELLNMADGSPIAAYRMAYIYHHQNDDAQASLWLQKAVSMSPKYIFPHRITDIPALEWAETVIPAWQTRYYLALVLYGTQQNQKALQLLLTCDEADFAPLFLTRAALQEGEEKLHSLLLSEKLDRSWRAGKELTKHYITNQQYDKALTVARRYANRFPHNHHLTLLYAKTLYLTNHFTECLNLLERTEILPYEGSTEGHDIYRDAYLGYARQLMEHGKYQDALDAVQKARLWPENLGVGKPYDYLIDTSREDLLESEIRSRM